MLQCRRVLGIEMDGAGMVDEYNRDTGRCGELWANELGKRWLGLLDFGAGMSWVEEGRRRLWTWWQGRGCSGVGGVEIAVVGMDRGSDWDMVC